VDALIRLTLGGLPPGRDGGLLNARLRYFDPIRKRAGLAEDVAALVSEMTETTTVVTLVNTNKTTPREVIVQGGAYAEHRIDSVEAHGDTTLVNATSFRVRLEPGTGSRLALKMSRYSSKATQAFPEGVR
jgi:hypothetical protein